MENEVTETLTEHFISLQEILTNLADKVNDLSENVAQLINLFTNAAKSFEEGQPSPDGETLKRLDMIAEQNRIIARGLSIIEERTRDQEMSGKPQPLPKL